MAVLGNAFFAFPTNRFIAEVTLILAESDQEL